MERVLSALGVLFGLVACGCAVAAIRTYVVLDVRGARDDLSGRRRERGVEHALELARTPVMADGSAEKSFAGGDAEDDLLTRLGIAVPDATLLREERAAPGDGEARLGREAALATSLFEGGGS